MDEENISLHDLAVESQPVPAPAKPVVAGMDKIRDRERLKASSFGKRRHRRGWCSL